MHADSPLRAHNHFQHASVANPEKNLPRSVLKNYSQNICYSGSRNGGRDRNTIGDYDEPDKENRVTELMEEGDMTKRIIKMRGDRSSDRGSKRGGALADVDFMDMKSPLSFLCDSAVKGMGMEMCGEDVNEYSRDGRMSRGSSETSMDSIRLAIGMSSPILAPSSNLGSPDTSIHHLDDLNDINDTCNDNTIICDELFENGNDDRDGTMGTSFLSLAGTAIKRKHGDITRSDSLNTEYCLTDINNISCSNNENNLLLMDREEEYRDQRERKRESDRMEMHEDNVQHLGRKIGLGLESVEEEEEIDFGAYCEHQITRRGRGRAESVRYTHTDNLAEN